MQNFKYKNISSFVMKLNDTDFWVPAEVVLSYVILCWFLGLCARFFRMSFPLCVCVCVCVCVCTQLLVQTQNLSQQDQITSENICILVTRQHHIL
jgi:uncharacterized membrane protein YjjP (DUF1212 family)